jgi:hypothetical protein
MHGRSKAIQYRIADDINHLQIDDNLNIFDLIQRYCADIASVGDGKKNMIKNVNEGEEKPPCKHCGKDNHKSEDCYSQKNLKASKSKKKKFKGFCGKCGKKGHKQAECPEGSDSETNSDSSSEEEDEKEIKKKKEKKKKETTFKESDIHACLASLKNGTYKGRCFTSSGN